MDTMRLQISGMTCDHCVQHVTEAIRGVHGVESAVVSLKRGSALVRHDHADATKLMKAVESAGYSARIDR